MEPMSSVWLPKFEVLGQPQLGERWHLSLLHSQRDVHADVIDLTPQYFIMYFPTLIPQSPHINDPTIASETQHVRRLKSRY